MRLLKSRNKAMNALIKLLSPTNLQMIEQNSNFVQTLSLHTKHTAPEFNLKLDSNFSLPFFKTQFRGEMQGNQHGEVSGCLKEK